MSSRAARWAWLGAMVCALFAAAGCSGPTGFVMDTGNDAAATETGVDAAMEAGTLCRSSADCNDNFPCTRDTCLVDGTCSHRPDDTQCMAGQVCNVGSGCGMPMTCRTAMDCNDNIPCTDDICGASGMCTRVPQNSRCPANQQCFPGIGCAMARPCSTASDCDDRVYCNGAETCNTELACVMGTPVRCDDMNPCTIDSCVESSRMCAHMMDPSCMGGMVRDGVYNVAMPVDYVCMPFGITAIDVLVQSFQFSVAGTMLTVFPRNTSMSMPRRGLPPTLMGTVSGAMFDVSSTRAGSCTEMYRMQGRFSDATHFTGTLTMTLAGLDCALCPPAMRTWPISGTAAM